MNGEQPIVESEGRRSALASVLALVAVILAVVAVALVIRNQAAPVVAASSGPSVVLDSALASGKPAYILIHSLT